jgi:hypothetical protein
MIKNPTKTGPRLSLFAVPVEFQHSDDEESSEEDDEDIPGLEDPDEDPNEMDDGDNESDASDETVVTIRGFPWGVGDSDSDFESSSDEDNDMDLDPDVLETLFDDGIPNARNVDIDEVDFSGVEDMDMSSHLGGLGFRTCTRCNGSVR